MSRRGEVMVFPVGAEAMPAPASARGWLFCPAGACALPPAAGAGGVAPVPRSARRPQLVIANDGSLRPGWNDVMGRGL